MRSKKILALIAFNLGCAAAMPNCNRIPPAEPVLAPSIQEPSLSVFVSFSMPEQSLKLWAEQAATLNAPLLLRGFVENSLIKTTAKTQSVFDNAGVDLFIDPESFEKFSITQVPAVVLVSSAPSAFDVARGDVTLRDALALIATKGSPEGQRQAQRLLEKMKDQHE